MHTEIMIIGAGPAGLAMAGRLRKAKLAFEVLEKSDKIASAWHGHYDRLHLHTVKQLSALPHHDFDDSYPTYVPRLQLIKYFEDYAQKFDIKPHFNTDVKEISRNEGKWHIRTQREEHTADHVIIATGVNRTMNMPKWTGQEEYTGKIIHSRSYRNPQELGSKKVLVVGMGNTGAEVAYDLSEHDVNTHISVRGEIGLIPRDVNGRPVQLTAKTLDKLPFGIGDWLGTQIRKIIIGDMGKYGLKLSKMHPAVQLKETGKTPVIDIGTAKAIKAGKIIVHPAIERFTASGVVFEDGGEEDFDTILLATGYRADIHDFLSECDGLFDKNGLPKEKTGKGKRKNMYFLGFDNYKLGGILGTIQDDSLLIIDDIIAKGKSRE